MVTRFSILPSRKEVDHVEVARQDRRRNDSNRIHWVGEVNLAVEGESVTGSIQWKSDRRHDGTDFVKGLIEGTFLNLRSTRGENHVRNPSIVPAIYEGMLTKNGRICFTWSPRSSGTKGAASGKLTNRAV